MPDAARWSAAAQRARFAQTAADIRARFRPLLDDRAHAERLIWWDQPRMELYAAPAFLAGDAADVAFGNTILRHVRDVLRPAADAPSPFEANGLATLLAEYAAQLEPDVHTYVRDLLAALAPFGLTADYQFHGYNDNMPVMWSWALTFAGDYYQRADLRAIARANLLQLKDLLRRRGTVAEYGLGYSTHRLTGLARTAELARDADQRELARQLEGRLWAELAGHYSPALGVIAGGSMRGGWPLNPETGPLFMHVFGDQLAKPWNNRETYYDTTGTIRDFGLDPAQYLFCYPFCYLAEFASAVYHVPDAVAPLFYRKRAPWRFACTAEVGYVNEGIFCKQVPVYGAGGVLITNKLTDEVVVLKDSPEHGAQVHGLTTYHGRHFALGTATTNLFGTSHALRCSYRRTPRPRTAADLGELLIRYNINGKVPGGRFKNTYWKSPDYPSREQENYCTLPIDMGRHYCLQHDATVLCLMTPEYREWWQLRELRADLCFYQPHAPVKAWQVAADGSRIDVDEGAVYFSLFPLIGRHGQRQEALRIRTMHEYLVISLYNYEGSVYQTTPHELAKLGNGFVLEVRDAEEYPSFAEFQAEMAQARTLDQLYGGRRRVHYARPGLRLSTHYCPYTHTVMQASINGVERELPQFATTGGLERRLPFLDREPAPGFADWAWLEAQHRRPRETYNPAE